MFETGIRQFRMAMGMVTGRRLNTANLARLVDDALATMAEFGDPGADVQQLLEGPLTDPAERQDFADRALRRTARRLEAQSPFYARRFAAADIQAKQLSVQTLRKVPLTVKLDLIQRAADFRCADVSPYLMTRTTGTTGRPAEIWLSRYEVDLWSCLGALASVLRDDLRPTDIVQVNVSSRAVAAVYLDSAVCRLVGAGCRLLGVVPPDESLDSLSEGQSTLLTTWPSYLGELVTAARRRGMGPNDFRLRRIDCGGEVLSASLAAAARQTFGLETVRDGFSMTEIIPVSARICSQGHLHHDLNMGLVELLDLETGEPAAPGSLATVVITPYFPYRECAPVLRYDTRDVVRCLPEEPLTCEVAGIPATGPVLGKADHLLRLGSGEVLASRAIVEALESLPSQPWPCRFRAESHYGRLRLTVPAGMIEGLGEAATVEHLAQQGLEAELVIVEDALATSLRHVRADLHETTFVGRPALIGE